MCGRFVQFDPPRNLKTTYLHLPEGAPRPESAEENRVGKTLAYLVADFIKSRHSTHSPTK